MEKILNPQSYSSNIIIMSMTVFIVLNIIENIIHFNTGKYDNTDDPNKLSSYLEMPTYKSGVKMVLVMIIFAFLQGFFTYVLVAVNEKN